MFLSVSTVAASEIDNLTVDDSGVQDDFNNQNEHYLGYENDISVYSLSSVENSSSYIESGNNEQLGVAQSFTALNALVQVGGEVVLTNDYTFDPMTDNFIRNGAGIALASPTVIEGNGHIINANFQTIIFRLNAADLLSIM